MRSLRTHTRKDISSLFLKHDQFIHFQCSQGRLNILKSSNYAHFKHELTTLSSKHNQSEKSSPATDHRDLGLQQELFLISKSSPGSPIFLPNGTKIFNRLVEFLRSQYEELGFQEVISPVMYKSSLWKTSGHWENYAEDMYAVTGRGALGTQVDEQTGQNEEYGLKPMNCPGHCLIFGSRARSYRDLPLRYADFSPLHRNEISGALSGLTRVRCFHQDDGHIFCRPSQIREEIDRSLEFVKLTYRVLGLEPYRLVLSTRPEKNFIGSLEEWKYAEVALSESLQSTGLDWTIKEGDGAFYGPKIDIIVRDGDEKEHQTATIQLDFQLPKRFQLHYQAPAPKLEQSGQICKDPNLLKAEGPVIPILIHRAVLGSVERMMALLIELYKGCWPFWLNPYQIAIITVNNSSTVLEYAHQTKRIIQGLGSPGSAQAKRQVERGIESRQSRIYVEIYDKAIGVQHKIAAAKRQRYGIIVLVGPKDIENQTISVDFSGIPIRNQYTSNLLQNVILKAGQYIPGVNFKPGELEYDSDLIKNDTQDTKDTLKTRTQVAIPTTWLKSTVHQLMEVYS